MRSRAQILALITVVVALALALHSEPVSQLQPTGYVNDFAHVLEPNAIAQLDDICRQVDTKAHAQIAVVTINSVDGSSIESYAVDLYKQWGVGAKSSNKGVLILLAVQDRKYRIEVGYGLEPILPDGKVGGFGREAVPLLRQNDYRGAVMLMTSRVADVIAQDAGVEIARARPSARTQPQHRTDTGSPIGGMILLGIIVFIVLFVPPLRRLLFWFLLFGGRGGGGGYRGGGYGGGGFGGGGGGFGGFGGGSSGGGGASGSW